MSRSWNKLLASSPLATVYLGGIAYFWTLKSPKTEGFSVVTFFCGNLRIGWIVAIDFCWFCWNYSRFAWWFGTWMDYFSIQLGRIIPTDELIFFRGVGYHQSDYILNWNIVQGINKLPSSCLVGVISFSISPISVLTCFHDVVHPVMSTPARWGKIYPTFGFEDGPGVWEASSSSGSSGSLGTLYDILGWWRM